MPARSVLLNVSIQARGWGREKANVVKEVKEVRKPEDDVIGKVEEGKRERVDSATAEYTPPPRNTTYGIATDCTTPPASAETPSFVTDVRACATCQQQTKRDGSALSHCKACTSVFYCSKDCQRVDWPSHKRQCVYRTCSNRDSLNSSTPISVPTSPTSL